MSKVGDHSALVTSWAYIVQSGFSDYEEISGDTVCFYSRWINDNFSQSRATCSPCWRKIELTGLVPIFYCILVYFNYLFYLPSFGSLQHMFLHLDGRSAVGSSDFVSPLEQLRSAIIVSNLTFNQDWSTSMFSRLLDGDSKLSSSCSFQTKSLAIS